MTQTTNIGQAVAFMVVGAVISALILFGGFVLSGIFP